MRWQLRRERLKAKEKRRFQGIMETAECERRKCQTGARRTKWWNEDVESAVRKTKEAYKKWLQLQTPESKDEYRRGK